jgi:hypothetical protein
MNWYAKNALPDNIKGIRGKDALDVVKRLNLIDKMPAVSVSVGER